jgi:predicted DNA-binding protein
MVVTERDHKELASAEQAAEAFADGRLSFRHDETVDAAAVPPREMADKPTTVVTSLRMPLDLYQRLKTAADRRGTTMAALLRGWAELELAAEEEDRPISRLEAIRALGNVPPLHVA